MTSPIPHPFTRVLAHIHHVSDLGAHYYYEVIYHDEEQWCSYAGSDTFNDGETVLDWRYAETCFTNNCPNCKREMKPGYDHICPPPDNHPDICYVENISDEINNYSDVVPTTSISNGDLLLLLRNYLDEVKLLEEKYGMSIKQLDN